MGVSGILYDFDVYLGKQPDTDMCKKYGKVGVVVLELVETLPRNVGHKVYMNNLFSSINLFNYLEQQGIWTVGTVRNNRLYGADKLMQNQKELQEKERGSLDYLVDANSNITIVRWIDNGMVQAISSFIGPDIGDDINCWPAKGKAIINVFCPNIIHQYNRHMSGVDLCDMLMALYRVNVGTKKWYFHIIYYCINVAIVNAWLIYKRHCQQKNLSRSNIMQLLEFQTRIANSLLREKKAIVGRPKSNVTLQLSKKRKSAATSTPADEIRCNNIGYLLESVEKQQRCKLCLVTNSNCFKKFHA